MRFRNVMLLAAGLGVLPVLARAQASPQDSAQAAQLRAIVEQIARDRPPQAEAAARQMVVLLKMQQAMYDSLRTRSLAEYWAEVAQLTVQRQMLDQADADRRAVMAKLFGAEAQARMLQRTYRDAPDTSQAAAIRAQLMQLLDRHFAAEDSLRQLEIAEVERRLVQVRAETDRRRRERAELVRRQVEQVLEDAKRP